MNLIKKCFTAVLFSASFLLFPGIAKTQNLIQNPGFEGSGGWFYTAGQVNLSPDAHSGSNSAYLHINGTDTARIGQYIGGLIPGGTYLFKYWVKASGMNHYLMPFIRFTSDTGNISDSYFCPNANITNWTQEVSRFIVPPGADSAIIVFSLFQTGNVYLDDFSLERVADTTSRNFTIYIDSLAGKFTDVLNTNGTGPGRISQPNNQVEKFKEAGIGYERTHDFHTAFDYHVIFPDTSLSASDPAAYHFHTTDSCIADILNAGGKVFYRFGESYETDHAHAFPPVNKQKFADVCVHIIKHYNDGWDNGYHYGLKYFEIWNEPDLKDFWTGTINDYITLYSATATAIKNYDPSLHVGGPALAIVFNESFMDSFLQAVASNHLPLDFFSYHFYYLMNPYYYKIVNEYVQQKLREYGLNAELVNSEWNPYIYSSSTFSKWGTHDPLNAACTASTLIYMQQSTIGKMFRYAFNNYWFGMVDEAGNWTFSGLVFKAFHELSNNNLQLCVSGADTLGTTIIASKNPSGTAMYAMISDNSSKANGYHLHCSGLGNNSWHYTIYRIDATHKLTEVATGTVSPKQPLISQKVRTPYVDYAVFDTPTKISAIRRLNFSIYPNPASNEIEIKTDSDRPFYVQIINIKGKIMGSFSFEKGRGKIDLRNLSNGTYLLRFNHSDLCAKIIIRK